MTTLRIKKEFANCTLVRVLQDGKIWQQCITKPSGADSEFLYIGFYYAKTESMQVGYEQQGWELVSLADCAIGPKSKFAPVS